ncbi:MAG: L,D-transpeptidase [Pseudomonadota bacterium]
MKKITLRISPAAAMIALMLLAVAIAAVIPLSLKRSVRIQAVDTSISSGGGFRSLLLEEEQKIDATPRVFIEVNIPATEFVLYEDGVLLFKKRVAIGRGVYPTPQQVSAIKKIEWNPWWYPPKAEWAKNDKPTPPGPRNPLGLVKMPLSDEILFHGTNASWSVGRPASHGCMRMHNQDATEIAWYLQERFSSQRDPNLREEYKKYGWKTYKVMLDKPVPVELVYRPVVARDGKLTFYNDYYQRVAGKHKAAIITELLRAGYEINEIDDKKIERLSRQWPVGDQIPITKLMRKPQGASFDEWPECS